LFIVQAAICAPLLEETLFRGALIPWLLRKRWRAGLVMVLALVFAIAESASSRQAGPAGFALVLLGGGVVLRAKVRSHWRTVAAIYASATLFAVVHSSVWPTPIPLFVLGLGLGWLAVRTRSILAVTILHGLFNLVSVLFVLRGG
jgi:membrane protease YdiL (CAAX protease family)